MSSTRVQQWILRNTTGLQYFVNERMAKRSGLIGRMFKAIEMGPREYGGHSQLKLWRVANFFWMQFYNTYSVMRPIFSRFLTAQQGPLNYSGLLTYVFFTIMIWSRFRFIRGRDFVATNQQDNPEFWFARYEMMFPPNFLHNRVSAHYIEINHIFAFEMIRKYQIARKQVLAERELASDKEKRTRYITNANYVYEPLKADAVGMTSLKETGNF